MLGLTGYPADRVLLGLAPDAPCYVWDLREQATDPALLRQACEWDDAAQDWRVKPGVAQLAARWPGQVYYTLNESTYQEHEITAERLARLHVDLQTRVDNHATLASPGFAQTEVVDHGANWWRDERYSVGPDGQHYPYAEAWTRWLLALGGKLPAVLSWHAYPRTRDGQFFCTGKQGVAFVKSVFQAVCRLRELWAGQPCRLMLTETGWLDWSAGGPAANGGWVVAQAYMAELVETYLRGELGDDICWFIPRSEACSVEGAIGGWPGYLVYSDYDPTGRYGTGYPCQPYWYGPRCEIGRRVGEPGTLTPLGELWRQGAGRAKLELRQWVPLWQ